MRTTAQIMGIIFTGVTRRTALGLLCLAALSGALSGCGTGSEALPSVPPPLGGFSLSITTTQMEDGVDNRSYSKTLNTTGGTPPLVSCTFLAGTPPPGLGIAPSGSDCIVSGIPTTPGSFTFTVRAQDTNNLTDDQDYTMAIRDEFTITGPAPDPLPDGVEDWPYNLVFTVTTDTVIGPNDFNQVAENGNGPITMCTLGGLPAGMMAVGGTFTANSCQITISGAPNIGIAPVPLGGMPQMFSLTLTVMDTPIAGSNTPAGAVTQMNIDLTIQPPVAITLMTADPMMTTCAGGTFDDSTGGGAAPDAVTGRTYGDPQCDLLFMATGGIVPYTWADNSAMPPTPFGCVDGEDAVNNSLFRCNSNMLALATAGGTATDVTVAVSDSGNAASAVCSTGTDIFRHSSHSIFVNDPVAVTSVLGDPLPDAVMGQMYGEAGVPASFIASDGLGAVGGYTFSTTTGLAMPGMGFPDTIGCNQTAPDTNDCATNMSTIMAAVGLYQPTMQADDMANDTTPSGFGTVTVDLTVLAPLTFTFAVVDAGTTATACPFGMFDDSMSGGTAPAAATGRTYGGPARCDLIFTASGGRPDYTWNVNSLAPDPIDCTQEGANGEFFRCNSGGNLVTATLAATLGVDVSDMANVALPAITENTDDQGHMGHLIPIQAALVTTLFTTDPGMTTGCTILGTFDDSTSGGAAPDAVTLRTYGNPRCDLMFLATGGFAPYAWTDDLTNGPAPFFCNDEGMDFEFFRCNSTMNPIMTAGGTLTTILTEVMDSGNQTTPPGTQDTDQFGHNAHTIFVNDEVAIVSDQGDPLPDAVQGQPYGEGTGMPVTFTASDGLGSYSITTMTGGMNNGDTAFPADIMCAQTNGSLSCATNMSTITADVGTYMPTVDADDVANDTTPSSATAGTTDTVTVSIDVVAAMMFTLITADAGTVNACSGGSFVDTGDAPDAVTGRTYGDPGGGAAGPPDCDLLFEVTGGRPPYTWTTTSLAPAPIMCNDPGEGADNAFLRCNSGGAAVSGGTAMLAVEVNDSGSSALGKIALTMDNQMHTEHVINVQNPLQVNVNFSPIPDGVTGRAYGNPGGNMDLIYTSSGGIPPTVNNNFMFMGFPAGIGCMQTTFTEIQCDSGGGDVGAAATYTPMVTVEDSPNDTTPMATVASDPLSTRTDTLEVNAEIVIDNTSPLVNGMVGQPYNVTFACDAGSGFCGGTGSPGNAAAMYTWSDDGGLAGVTFPGPFPVAQPGSANLSGAPTMAGMSMVTVSVTDDDGGGNANATTPSCTTAGTCPSVMYNVTVLAPLAFVADTQNSTTHIIDTSTHTETGASPLATSLNPIAVAVSPNGSLAYVSGGSGDNVVGIDTTVPSVSVVSIPVGEAPIGIGFTPDGAFAYVANGDPGLAVTPDTVSVINTATNMEITQVDLTDGAITDPGPGRVAVTPDGSLAYVTGRFDDVVQVISTATNTLVMTITDTSFNHPLGLAITPDGRFAYVGNRMGGTVSVLDLSSNTVTTAITVGTGPHDIAITPDGRFAYVPNKNSDDVSVIDLATNTVVTTITIGNDPHGAAVTPDGAFVYISYDGGAEVRVIDTSTNAEIGAGSPIPFGAPGGLRQIAAIQNPSLNIPTDTLPAATVGSAYSFSVAAGGGTPPRTFTIDAAGAAALAAHGLAFNSAGLISSGSVTGPAATLMLNVTVTDSSTPATSVTKTVTLQIM